MTQTMMDCGMGGWLGGVAMMGGGVLLLIALVLAIAALVKYLIGHGGRESRP